MQLSDALRQIAGDSGLDADALIAFAAEDNYGGRDTGEFAAMSVHRDEGRVLYALVRALRPKTVIEVGVAQGCTSTHILTALAANEDGFLWSYDIETDGVGAAVPDELRDRWALYTGEDALSIDDMPPADFIFEDGPHTYPWTRDMLRKLALLNPRMIVTHDFYTEEVYPDFKVQQSFREAFGYLCGVKIDGAFTGLGYAVGPFIAEGAI